MHIQKKHIILLWLLGLFATHSFSQNSLKDSLLTQIEHQSVREKADSFYRISKNEKSPDSLRKYAQLALYWAKKAGSKELMAENYKSIGASYHMVWNYPVALAYYDSALAFFLGTTEFNSTARTYSNKTDIFIKLGSLDSASANLEKFEFYAKKSSDTELKKFFLKRKANLLSIQGDYLQSNLILKELIELLPQDTINRLNNLIDIGLNFYKSGNNDSALYYYQLTKSINQLKFKQIEIVTLSNQANVYLLKGDFENTMKCYLEAIVIADSVNDLFSANSIRSNLANLYFEWEKYEQSIAVYKESLTYFKENGILKSLSINLLNIGIAFQSLNQTDSAFNYLNQALDISHKTDDYSLLSIVYQHLGRFYHCKNQYSKAIECFEQGLKYNSRDSELNTHANILHDLSLTYSAMHLFSKAYQLADSAKNIYSASGNLPSLVSLELSLAHIYHENNLPEKAYNQLISHMELKDSVFNMEKHQQISELETKYKTAEKENQIQKQYIQLTNNELEINRQKNKALSFGILLAVAIIIILGILIFLLRNRQKHQLIKSRLEQKSMELEGRLLRSQMNPHFIFNSLNSIQSYITSNNQYQAEIYLSKFAKLMRSILENSRHAFVSLDQDLVNLITYMELEQLRFEDQFSYTLTIDEDIDMENTYIPPMLIQPYIENSIIHGLVGKNHKDGVLKVTFTKLPKNALKCTVEDNGIGRELALELKKRSIKSYKSLGMEVTKERMNVISTMNQVKFEEHYTDLKDEFGKPTGTRVELIIPFEKD